MRPGGNIEPPRHDPAGPAPRALRTRCPLTAGALTFGVTLSAVVQQEESDAARRLQPITSDSSVQSDAARRAAAQAETSDRPSSVVSDLARFGISPNAIRRGEVVAVQPHRTVVTDMADLSPKRGSGPLLPGNTKGES
jgi:hypothetical protein